MTVVLNNLSPDKHLFSSFHLNKDSSKDCTGLGTRISNMQSQQSALKLERMEEIDNNDLQELNETPESSDSESQSSSVQQSSIEHNNNNNSEMPEIAEFKSSLTLNLLQCSIQKGLFEEQISRDFLLLGEKKAMAFGVSLRGVMNEEMSFESLSNNNPVSDEINYANDLNEYKASLYDIINDTIITISSICEFDKEKDWLAQQVAPDSSESEGRTTVRELAQQINIGMQPPSSPSNNSMMTSH